MLDFAFLGVLGCGLIFACVVDFAWLDDCLFWLWLICCLLFTCVFGWLIFWCFGLFVCVSVPFLICFFVDLFWFVCFVYSGSLLVLGCLSVARCFLAAL